MMDPVLGPFTDLLRTVKLGEPQIPFVSNVTARMVAGEVAASPEYWAGHVRQTVQREETAPDLWLTSRALERSMCKKRIGRT